MAETTATHQETTEIFREITEDMMIDRHTQTAGTITRGIGGNDLMLESYVSDFFKKK